MRSLLTKYVDYFNRKYQRIGPLFQGRYKGVLIDKEGYFLHLSSYIYNNPKEILPKEKKLIDYPWSSYPAYAENWQAQWLKKDYILSFFKKTQGFGFDSYQEFVEGYKEKDEDNEIYGKLLLD